MPFTSKQKQREYQREYQRRRRGAGREDEAGFGVSPEIKIAIIVTALFALAALGLLSFFELAGILGAYIKAAFLLAFGWGAVIFPVLLTALGITLLRGVKYQINRFHLVGFVLIFLGILGIMHHAPDFAEPSLTASLGQGGGYVGWALSRPFIILAGYWGGWVFLAALLAVGVILSFSGFLFNRAASAPDEDQGATVDIMSERQTWLAQMAEKFNAWRYRRLYKAPIEGNEPEPAAAPEAAVVSTLEADGDLAMEVKPAPRARREIKIPLDLLDVGKEKPSADDIEATKEKIARTLATFGINVDMGEVSIGPSITQYTFKPAEGIKLSRITSLANDLSLALAAHPLRIEAPIPGKSLVGVEVPNRSMAAVKLKDILQSTPFRSRTSNLSIALGKDVAGRSWVVDLARMPHLLIAGSTGSGKSVAINSIIVSLMYQNSPDDLKFILVDPKKVELVMYNEIPYLLTPVITDVKKTINALKWVIGEMERRYQLLSERGKRNIAAYNEANKKETLPYIVFVIDELADLMSVAANEVEGAIVRLAQMARAVGIHLVLATQRPSVDVITGLIKANVSARLAFSVPSQIDSRTILDIAGAEKLLGRGDMLFLSPELGKPRRIQGAFLEDEETERVVNFLKGQGEAEYHDEIVERPARGAVSAGDGGDDDALYTEAKAEVMRAGKASASLLQRRLRIGYARAARLLDIFESEGIIGPADGAKPRDILISRNEEVDLNIESNDYPNETEINNS